MTQKSRFDRCKYVVVQILKQDSTLDTLDKVVFVTNPFYPNDIPFEVNDTTASKMRASVINKRIHGRPIYNHAILADMPDSNSFSSKSKIAFAKIALGVKKRRSIVFNKADTVSTFNGVYYIFDFEARLSPFSSKENFTIFDITVDKRLYEISHYYMIRIKDGGKEKKKVIVAHTNGIPLEHCDSLLTR